MANPTEPTEYIYLTAQEIGIMIQTGIQLGHMAAGINMSCRDACEDAVEGPEFESLIESFRRQTNRRR